MKVLIDTNVILDVLCARPDFVDHSLKVFKLCEENRIKGYISAISVPNIVYIMRKELDSDRIRDILDKLSSIFTIADLRETDLKAAAELAFSDYEDGLQSACACRIKADYIVTRNIRDFAKSAVPAILPSDLPKKLQ